MCSVPSAALLFAASQELSLPQLGSEPGSGEPSAARKPPLAQELRWATSRQGGPGPPPPQQRAEPQAARPDPPGRAGSHAGGDGALARLPRRPLAAPSAAARLAGLRAPLREPQGLAALPAAHAALLRSLELRQRLDALPPAEVLRAWREAAASCPGGAAAGESAPGAAAAAVSSCRVCSAMG